MHTGIWHAAQAALLAAASAPKDCSKCAHKLQILIGGPYTKHGELQRYGHAALRVVTPKSDVVYDFGRYGKTWGTGGSEGEGILRVWTNFSSYIAGENALGRTTTGFTLCVTAQQADAAKAPLEAQVKSAKLLGTSGSGFKSYRLAKDYHALNENCTTKTLEGAVAGLPQIDDEASPFNKGEGLSGIEKAAVTWEGWPDTLFMPADLKAYLGSNQFKLLALSKGLHNPCVDTFQAKKK